MGNFAEVIKEQIIKRKQTRRAKKLVAVIDGPDSRKRDRILARLERHAKVFLEQEGVEVENDDWRTVGERDWSKFFDSLLKFIMAILPMILSLFA